MSLLTFLEILCNLLIISNGFIGVSEDYSLSKYCLGFWKGNKRIKKMPREGKPTTAYLR
jgi:hypothetical protein